MKKLITLLFTTLLTSLSYAQCIEVAGGFGNNTNIPMYNIEGDVIITLNTSATISLDLGANFMTAAGPDIRAFLVNSNGLTDVQLVNTQIGNLENLQFGLVGDLNGTNQNGAKSFTIDIPIGTQIENFDKIFFYCLQFDQFWDFGTITPFNPTNCALLETEDFQEISFAISPNPASTQISISGVNLNNSEIRIFDILGKQVYQNRVIANKILDISALNSGVYLISVLQEGIQTTKKLVVK
jgi:hypothetical protein